MWYMLWDSGCTHSTNPYFELYTQCKTLDKGYDTEVNGIRGIIKPKGIGTTYLYLEDATSKIHNIIIKHGYYYPGSHKLLISPEKWAWDRGEDEVRREGK